MTQESTLSTNEAIPFWLSFDLLQIAGQKRIFKLAVPMAIIATFSYFFVDQQIAWQVNSLSRPTRQLASRLTQLGHGGNLITAAVVLLIVGLVAHRRRLQAWAAMTLVSVVASGLLVNLLKVIFGRQRPKCLIQDGGFGFVPFSIGYQFNGFPSGHSTASGAFYLMLILLLPKGKHLWPMVAFCVALTRVLTNSHYPSDVMAGLLLGVISSSTVVGFAVRRGFWPQK